MALMDSYTSGDDTYFYLQGASRWMFQTWVTSTAYTITSIKAFVYRTLSPGTLTCEIYAVDGGLLPTGATLCSGTTDGDTLPTGSPYEWREITLGAGSLLSTGTSYALVLKALAGDASNYIRWRIDSSTGYATGRAGYNTGAWALYGTQYDFLFEIYGTAAGWANIAKVGSIAAADITKMGVTAVADIAKINGVAV